VTTPAVVNPESVTEVLAVRVLKVPAAAVPPPMAPGAAKVAPLSELAFRLATLVVEAITSGAVPVETVEVSWVPETIPVEVMAPEPMVPAPVMLPAAEILIVGEVRKLLKPVPKVRPLKLLLVIAVTLPKLRPVMVLALALALVAPTKDRSRPLTLAAVDEALELVIVKAWAEPVTELE
jgi:hypothetical protein